MDKTNVFGTMKQGKNGALGVVIPSYVVNEIDREYLRAALESVPRNGPFAQLVVVDDGSASPISRRDLPDDAELITQPNRGVSAARNQGLHAINTEFVVFLDADDLLLGDGFSDSIEYLRRPENKNVALLGGRVRMIDSQANVFAEQETVEIIEDFFVTLLEGNQIWCPAAAIMRTEAVRKIGGFNNTLSPCADYDLYLRLAAANECVFGDSFLAHYRLRSGSMSQVEATGKELLHCIHESVQRTIDREPQLRKHWLAGVHAAIAYYFNPQTLEAKADLLRRLSTTSSADELHECWNRMGESFLEAFASLTNSSSEAPSLQYASVPT
jgi:Glycosyl transferase family 2